MIVWEASQLFAMLLVSQPTSMLLLSSFFFSLLFVFVFPYFSLSVLIKYRNTGVPVGLIGAYWSGTNIYSWTSRDSLAPCNYTLPVGGMRRGGKGREGERGRERE